MSGRRITKGQLLFYGDACIRYIHANQIGLLSILTAVLSYFAYQGFDMS